MNKRQKLYLAILVVLVIVFLLTKTSNNVEKRIKFFQADSAKITTIEISNIKDTLRLSKKDNEWMMVEPFEYPVSEQQIKQIFAKVLPVQTSNLPISENENSFDTYKVTSSQGTGIKFYDENDKLLDGAIIGKSSSSGSTPARRPDENKIYKLEENISYLISTDTNSWREKTILEIDKSNISKISVLFADSAYELTLTDSLWQYADGQSTLGIDLNNNTLKDILTSLSKITVSGFYDNMYKEYQDKLTEPDLEIGIELFDGSTHYVRVAMDKDPKYVMQFDTDTEFLYSVYKNWVDKFTKEAMDFK